MNNQFKEIKLGEILHFRNGKSIKSKEEGKYPVFGSNGLIGKSNKYKHKNAIIIGRVGAYCGSVEYCEGQFWASDNTIVAWQKDNAFSTQYLYYLLGWLNLHNYAGGSAQPLLTQTVLKQIKTEVPPPPTQRKIAAVLSAYDDLIENNTRRIAILEQMAQLIYREWFVHFRFPGYEDVAMVDSELGSIPEGWEITKLGDVVELAYGKGLRKKDRIPGSYPVYGSSGVIDFHNEPLVEGPGIIVGRKGNVGSVYWSDEGFCPIDTVFYVKTDVNLRYTYYNLQHQNFIGTHTAVPGLSRNQAYLLPFLIPDKSTLQKFEHIIEILFAQKGNLESRSQILRRTRDLLLPRLIAGEVDVTDLDIV